MLIGVHVDFVVDFVWILAVWPRKRETDKTALELTRPRWESPNGRPGRACV
jgi:hypothetical protein